MYDIPFAIVAGGIFLLLLLNHKRVFAPVKQMDRVGRIGFIVDIIFITIISQPVGRYLWEGEWLKAVVVFIVLMATWLFLRKWIIAAVARQLPEGG